MSDMRDMCNAVAERLWEVVQSAIQHGVTPEEFRREAAACWAEVHVQEAERATNEFLRSLK